MCVVVSYATQGTTGTDDGDDIAGEKEQQIAQVDDGVEKAEWKPKNATDCCREQRTSQSFGTTSQKIGVAEDNKHCDCTL